MSSTAVGRRRGLPKQMSSEDQALNMIAREAEARLAAKRAARAEARSIRMKELEKKQKEADEQMDKEYEREHEDPLKRRVVNSRIKTTASSSLNSSESSIDDLGLHTDEYVKQLKDNLKEVEDKFRKAMVNSAQLDNERQAYQYQVECLKDMIEDMTENLDNIKDELMHKTKDFQKLSRDHEKLNEEFEKCMKLLADRERILDEHGINLDGTLRDEPDGGIVTTTTTETDTPIQNHILDHSEFSNAEKEALESEIQLLKEEIAELRNKNEGDLTKREAEHIRTAEGAELERSFVDVSDEANAIQDDIRHRGLFVNNNEKCDEFEVIDDGSQQGGIKNFEDKSFEKSDRTSLMSSIQTGISDSMESDLPLEISVDINQSDKYDIVSTGDETKPRSGTELNINSLTAANIERSQSPLPASNLNIDKYFMYDDNDTNDDELQTSTTFSINQYFASEENPDDIKIDTDSTEILEQDHHFENIDTSVLESLKENRCTESPYLEVDAQIPQKDDTKNDSQFDGFQSVSLDDISKQEVSEPLQTPQSSGTLENNPPDEKYQDIGVGTDASVTESTLEKTSVILEASLTEETPVHDFSTQERNTTDKLSDVASQTLDTELNQAFNSTEQNVSLGSEYESSAEYEFTVKKPTAVQDDVDGSIQQTSDGDQPSAINSIGTPVTEEEADNANTVSDQPPIKDDAQENLAQSDLDPESSKTSVEEHVEVRKNVEDLYDMIAQSAVTKPPSHDNESNESQLSNDLPEGATFGMFAVSTHVSKDSHSKEKDPVFGLVVRQDNGSVLNQPESPVRKKKEGWLVRVESFNAPKSNAPRIQQVRSKSEEIDPRTEGANSPVTPQPLETPNIPKLEVPEENEPVPKERKKKKKSKKNKGNAKIHENKDDEKNDSSRTGAVNDPKLSAPELLGYTSDSPSHSPSPSPNIEKRSSKSSNSEIPQQFLDVQFNVAGDSDLSDVENDSTHANEQTKKKPDGPNKRGSKKENCKTQ